VFLDRKGCAFSILLNSPAVNLRRKCFALSISFYHLRVGAHSPAVNVEGRKGSAFSISL
jgi:hypothetical protein